MWILNIFSLTPKGPEFPHIPQVPGEIAPTGHTQTVLLRQSWAEQHVPHARVQWDAPACWTYKIWSAVTITNTNQKEELVVVYFLWTKEDSQWTWDTEDQGSKLHFT